MFCIPVALTAADNIAAAAETVPGCGGDGDGIVALRANTPAVVVETVAHGNSVGTKAASFVPVGGAAAAVAGTAVRRSSRNSVLGG